MSFASKLIWVWFTLCLAVSFLLSGMEAGVFALSRLRIRQQMRAGQPSARILYGFLDNPENFLWTILVGNTLANLVILGWLFAALYNPLRSHFLAFAAVYGAVVFLVYAFFDLLPKMLFRRFPNRLCLALSPPFRIIYILLRPLVGLVEGISRAVLRWRGGKAFTGRLFGNREELRQLMQESGQAFTSEERAMINRVLDLQTLTVRQVMKPLSQAVTIHAQAPASEGLALCREKNHTRLPAWETRENRRRIIGLLNCGTLLYESEAPSQKRVAEVVQPALYLDEDMRAEVALRRLQRSGQRLAIVLGPDRTETGILSLQDILQVIFGKVGL
jgi:CBS domain containing-hemolysin-like protein